MVEETPSSKKQAGAERGREECVVRAEGGGEVFIRDPGGEVGGASDFYIYHSGGGSVESVWNKKSLTGWLAGYSGEQ